MADNPEKPGPIQTYRWREETILPALLLQEDRRGHQKPNRVGEKDKKANGRKGRKSIHKNPVVYEEEETFQRFRSEIIEACKTSHICPSQGRTEETESLISCFPVQWRHGNWNFQNLSNCARPRVAVSHWLTSPEQKCADPVP
ncbi:hypothetical protein CDAR_112321 [Caerostris darwini]|uniref:Uncharacterized protein n=1 Tax=Caerostris darwini TaxID=1538125 RepID=A0AAV4P6C4_9ARAC|nr:hypothetical protein CDAR_112321 [Caerostris darwini]